jgi:SAM-dependent methyltransferase
MNENKNIAINFHNTHPLKWIGDSSLAYKDYIKELVVKHGAKTMLDYGCGKGWQYEQGSTINFGTNESPITLDKFLGIESVYKYDPGVEQFNKLPDANAKFDCIILCQSLAFVADADMPKVKEYLMKTATKFVFIGEWDPLLPISHRKIAAFDPELYKVKRTKEWYYEQFSDWQGPELKFHFKGSSEGLMKTVFESIYQEGRWILNRENVESLSGPGSFPSVVGEWISTLKSYVEENSIKSVVDYGCGDFAIYKNFDWSNVDYLGIDISELALELARKNSEGRTTVKFLQQDSLTVPPADLLIVKDVFGHWSGRRSTFDLGDLRHLITDFLKENLHKFKHVLILDAHDQVIEDYFTDEFKPDSKLIRIGTKKYKKLYIYKS